MEELRGEFARPEIVEFLLVCSFIAVASRTTRDKKCRNVAGHLSPPTAEVGEGTGQAGGREGEIIFEKWRLFSIGRETGREIKREGAS